MNQIFFHITFVIIFVIFFIIRATFHRRARQAMGQVAYKEGKLHTGLRIVFGFPFMVMVFVYCFKPGILAWATVSMPLWAQWFGLFLGIITLPFIYWIQWALGDNFSTTLHVRQNHTLVTHGPYQWVRHPMYTLFYMQCLAFLLLTQNWFISGVYVVALSLIVITRLKNEEAAMIEKFGEQYHRYMQNTGRFFPRFSKITR